MNQIDRTLLNIKKALKDKLDIEISKDDAWDFGEWIHKNKNSSLYWHNYNFDDFEIINYYNEFINEIIKETTRNIGLINSWSDRKEDNIYKFNKKDIDTFIKTPCYANFSPIIEWLNNLEKINDEILSIFYYNNKLINYDIIRIMLCSLADAEIKINNKKTIEKIESYLYSENARVAQSAAGCLLSCCGEISKNKILISIKNNAIHKNLIERLIK